jgi:Gram-negative porin
VKSIRSFLLGSFSRGLALSAAVFFHTGSARADITLLENKDWTVFVNGRMQAFINYNTGGGRPISPNDANNNAVTLLGGGDNSPVALKEGENPARVAGEIRDLRIRTGFVGNVIGFGFKNRLTLDTEITGYTAVTTYIDSTARRKYAPVSPDWRESYLKVAGPWGSVVAGRTLVLFSRGATEITYLYGFKYGLGWVGNVSSLGDNGPGAGLVGFGVLGNGFGAGVAYATPDIYGLQVTVGLYDANNIPGSGTLERTRWPRAESEVTYERKVGDSVMFKLFANGAWQKIYERSGFRDQTISGVGYGGRLEVGPVHLGLAGHQGKGIGVNFALEPNDSGWHPTLPERTFRQVDGYSAHLQVSPSKKFDFMAAAGITRVLRLNEDKVDTRDTDNDDPNGDGFKDANPTVAATPVGDDDGVPGPDSVGFVPIKHQIGLSAGATYHISENLHLALEYFRAMFKWHTPVPSLAGADGEEQNFHLVNLGVTYDF